MESTNKRKDPALKSKIVIATKPVAQRGLLSDCGDYQKEESLF